MPLTKIFTSQIISWTQILWLCLALIVTNEFPLWAQNPTKGIRRIGAKDGLYGSPVLSIGKDKYGFMWIGTANGLNRFDGERILQYHAGKATGLVSDKEYSLVYTDKNGGLWVVAENRYIYRYNYDADQFIPITGLPNFNHVTCLLLDDSNSLWIGTYNGLYQLDSLFNSPINPTKKNLDKVFFSENSISYIQQSEHSCLWIGTYNGILAKLNLSSKSPWIARFFLPPAGKGITYNPLVGMINDRYHNTWLLLENRLSKINTNDLNKDTGTYMLNINPAYTYKPEDKIYNYFSISYDNGDNLFLQAYNCIYSFDIIQKKFTRYFEDAGDFFESDNSNIALFYDRSGKLLWTSIIGGLAILNTRADNFYTIRFNTPDQGRLSSNEVLTCMIDSKDNLWIGTNGQGLSRGVKREGNRGYTFGRICHKPGINTNISGNAFMNIQEPVKGEILVVSDKIQKVIAKDNGIYFMDYKKCKDLDRYPVGNIVSLGGFRWIMRIRSTINLSNDSSSKDYEFYLNNKRMPFAGWQLMITPDSQYFMRGMNGILYRFTLPLVKVGKEGYMPTRYEALNDTDLQLKDAVWMLTTLYDHVKYFWFNTPHSGLLEYKLSEAIPSMKSSQDNRARLVFVKNYRVRDGLPDDRIQSMLEDKKGRIWIATLNGLSCMIPGKNIFSNFNEADGLPENRMLPSFDMDKDGNIYFLESKRLVYFNPDSLLTVPPKPSAFISEITVSGNPVPVNQGGIIHNTVLKKGSVVLAYTKSNFSIELGNLSYFSPEESYFRFMLDGIDKNWREERVNHNVEYGILPPGEYRFHLFSVLKNGLTTSDELTLDIHIKTPFYYSTLFYILLGLFSVISLYLVFKIREKNLKFRAAWLENTVQKKTAEILEQREIVDKMKSRFFTNISHEFRTPLTLIMGSADALTGVAESSGTSRLIGTIKNASQRLLKLVNELLDLAKLEAGTLKLRTEYMDIAWEVKFIVKTYLSDAERRKIKLYYSSVPEKIFGWFDREFIQKIMHNLVSNTLKFTSADGEIKVQIQVVNEAIENRAIKILVIDTGKGIAAGDLSRIFDRFYQVEDTDKRSAEGTGIGLSIVQELVQRHHGTIQVESTLGQGTGFEIILPCGSSSFAVDEKIQRSHENRTVLDMQDEGMVVQPVQESQEMPLQKVKSKEKSTILLVEDNAELREYLAEALRNKYIVMLAENGQAAFEKATDLLPDIIVSDIMMPVSDGLELCQQVKENDLTSHIPVILLTAKADMDSRLAGLHTGADDYLVKPFNLEELTVRVENLLVQRARLKQKFARLNFIEKQSPGKQSRDDEFLCRIISKIEINLVRTDFSIVNLAAEMNISQRSLERKIHALTDLTPVEFLRKVKIKYAARLIADGRTDVSGAAYESGFLSLSYFSRVFAENMGVSPAEYRKQNTKPV